MKHIDDKIKKNIKVPLLSLLAKAFRCLNCPFSLSMSRIMFGAARQASKAIGAQIVLGDKPMEITLERAWNSLRWTEKHSLVLSVESSEDNGTFQLYEQLSFSYPSFKIVNRSKGVVGVIGKSHMNGVIYALISDQGNLCFKDLVGGKRPYANASNGWIGRLLNSLIRDTIIGFIL
ncbi:hypothetical protein UlMin_037501 [Ulmus minor]